MMYNFTKHKHIYNDFHIDANTIQLVHIGIIIIKDSLITYI